MKIALCSRLLRSGLALAAIAVTGAAHAAGSSMSKSSTSAGMSGPSVEMAIARLEPTQGSHVTGTVRFTRQADGVQVNIDLKGLSPGKHGFHVHENGDCSAPDASSAGGHYNPTHAPHAARMAEKRHVGDLGNIEADEDGEVHTEYVDHMIALEGEHSIVGKAVIVHAKADDLKSQPSGDAGARVACGVIEALH